MLEAESPPPNEADGIRSVVAEAASALGAGDAHRAAQCFIDFWMGPGAWAAMPESRKSPIAASIANIRGWARALMDEPTPLAAFAELDMPVLYMMGKDSPASSRGVGRLLTQTLPRVRLVEFDGLGHMGPLTHPKIVNQAICRFFERA